MGILGGMIAGLIEGMAENIKAGAPAAVGYTWQGVHCEDCQRRTVKPRKTCGCARKLCVECIGGSRHMVCSTGWIGVAPTPWPQSSPRQIGDGTRQLGDGGLLGLPPVGLPGDVLFPTLQLPREGTEYGEIIDGEVIE